MGALHRGDETIKEETGGGHMRARVSILRAPALENCFRSVLYSSPAGTFENSSCTAAGAANFVCLNFFVSTARSFLYFVFLFQCKTKRRYRSELRILCKKSSFFFCFFNENVKFQELRKRVMEV